MNSNIFRCGWCGNITDKMGVPLAEKEWERAAKLLNNYGDYRTVKVNGDCCKHEFNY